MKQHYVHDFLDFSKTEAEAMQMDKQVDYVMHKADGFDMKK